MKKLTMNKLASMICLKEGKKHQASIGDVREILRILAEAISDTPATLGTLVDAALRVRAARKLSARKK